MIETSSENTVVGNVVDPSGLNESEINKLKDKNRKMRYQIKNKNRNTKKTKECATILNQDRNKWKGGQDRVIQEIDEETHHKEMTWRHIEKVKRFF